MNSKQLMANIYTVSKNIFWADCIISDEMKKLIEKTNRFKFLEKSELEAKINELKAFDGNLIWDRKFWGLKAHESISFVASGPYNFFKNLK